VFTGPSHHRANGFLAKALPMFVLPYPNAQLWRSIIDVMQPDQPKKAGIVPLSNRENNIATIGYRG